MKYVVPSRCPVCGYENRLTEKEVNRTIHCQVCYIYYEHESLTGYTSIKKNPKEMKK